MTVKGFISKAETLLSPSVLFWMVSAWVFLYVTLTTWTEEAFGKYITSLSSSLPVQIPFVIFLILALVNLLKFAARSFKASRVFAPMWIVLPAGIVLFATGFYISAVYSQTGRIFVGQEDPVRPPWQKDTFFVSKVESGLKDEVIDIGTEEGLIFSFSPRLYLEGKGKWHEVGVFPPTEAGGTYYHIMDFGLAPGVTIRDNGNVVSDGYVILRILPPGVRGDFTLPPLPYRFTLSMLPFKQVSKGGKTAGMYNLKNPLYEVVIEKGSDVLFKGDSSEAIRFDDLEADFYEPVDWVWLEAVKNPGLKVLAAGCLMIAAGLPLWVLMMTMRLYRVSRAGGGHD